MFHLQNLLELDLETTMPQKNPKFYLEIHVQSIAYSSFSRSEINTDALGVILLKLLFIF